MWCLFPSLIYVTVARKQQWVVWKWMIFGCVPIKLYLKKIDRIGLSGHSFLTYLFSSWFQLFIIAFFWRLLPPPRVLIFGNIRDSGHTCGCFLFRTFPGVWSPYSILVIVRMPGYILGMRGCVVLKLSPHRLWSLAVWLEMLASPHTTSSIWESSAFILSTFSCKRKTLVT